MIVVFITIIVVTTPVVAVIVVTIAAKCEDFRDPHMIPLICFPQKLHFLGSFPRNRRDSGCLFMSVGELRTVSYQFV